jgi:hypothetical protein
MEAATSTGPKFPDVTVRLVGSDGNAFAVLGAVQRAMRKAGHDDQVAEFMAEATAGDYDGLLRTCMKWVEVA